MAYDQPLKSDPSPMPIKPAVLILLHKRKKAAFISYSSNARGRAAVIASMIRHRPAPDDTSKKAKKYRNHLRDLPDGDIKEFAVLAVMIGIDARKANEAVEKLQKKFERDGYTLFGGSRSAIPAVTLDGKRMTIVDAIAQSKCKDNYQTVYRRIQRGWTTREALGLVARAA